MSSPASKKLLWTGRILSAAFGLLMLFAAVPKLLLAAPVVAGFKQMGFPESSIPIVGTIELVCTILYLVPRTRVLGAILVTGVLGGALATNVRIGDPTWIAPAVLGVLAWGGLFLRDPDLRALIPTR